MKLYFYLIFNEIYLPTLISRNETYLYLKILLQDVPLQLRIYITYTTLYFCKIPEMVLPLPTAMNLFLFFSLLPSVQLPPHNGSTG